MSASLGKVLKYAGMLGIGVLLLTLAMRGVDDPQALWDDMRSASGWSIGASFVMGYLAIVSRGMRWLILLDHWDTGPRCPTASMRWPSATSPTPSFPGAGNWPGGGALNQTDDIPVDELFGTVISERVVDFALLFLLTGIALCPTWTPFWPSALG